MSGNARAFWVTAPGVGEVRDEGLLSPGEGEVLVQALYGAVSRGTEALVFGGRVPESEYERMRCPFQAGEFPGPVKYGYSNVGRVVEGGAALCGRTVLCLYPHQTAYVLPESAALLVPDSVPAARAVLAPNMETAVNALWDARPLLGDRISVVGAGVVGSLVAFLAGRCVATEVELVDVRAERAAVASALGVSFAEPAQASPERDLVFHASGTAEGLRAALALCAPEGSVVELSWFGDQQVALPLGRAFHARRITLRSSQVGTVSPHARARFGRTERLSLALELCESPALDVLFSGESDFEALPETMVRIAAAASGALCERVRYS